MTGRPGESSENRGLDYLSTLSALPKLFISSLVVSQILSVSVTIKLSGLNRHPCRPGRKFLPLVILVDSSLCLFPSPNYSSYYTGVITCF